MATLEQVIAEVQEDIRALSGIRAAPNLAPEQMNVFPFCVVYPGSGTMSSGVPGEMLGIHSIVIELHIGRKDLPRDIDAALPFVESIPNILLKAVATTAGDRFDNTVDTFTDVTYEFGPLDWGGTATIGWRFRMNGVKLRNNIV